MGGCACVQDRRQHLSAAKGREERGEKIGWGVCASRKCRQQLVLHTEKSGSTVTQVQGGQRLSPGRTCRAGGLPHLLVEDGELGVGGDIVRLTCLLKMGNWEWVVIWCASPAR